MKSYAKSVILIVILLVLSFLIFSCQQTTTNTTNGTTTHTTQNTTTGATVVTSDETYYLVTLNLNDGSIVIHNENFTAIESWIQIHLEKGDELDISTPTKYGCEFIGWYLNDELYDLDTPITSNITLEAVWQTVFSTTGTFKTFTEGLDSLNPHAITNEDHYEYLELVYDTLYKMDYDWEYAMELGLADDVNDFSNHELLPIEYVASMAINDPTSTDGLTWTIEISPNHQFDDGMLIDANTFYYSLLRLLDPKLNYTNACLLFDKDYLVVANAKEYFEQGKAVYDELGYQIYTKDEVNLSRENSLYGTVIGHPDWFIYHVDQSTEFAQYVGPNGQMAFVEDYGYDYGIDGFVLENEAGEGFVYGTDGVLYAPEQGWYFNDVEIPYEFPSGVSLDSYVGALPAYADSEGNLVEVDDLGFPTDADLKINQPVNLSNLGIKVIDQNTLEITLLEQVSVEHMKYVLSIPVFSPVHPILYEEGLQENGAWTNYGTNYDTTTAYGPYNITFFSYDEIILNRNYQDASYQNQYLVPNISITLYDSIDEVDFDNLYANQELDSFPLLQGDVDNLYVDITKYYLKSYQGGILLNLDYGHDENDANDNPSLANLSLRKALYFAMNRELFNSYRTGADISSFLVTNKYMSDITQRFTYRQFYEVIMNEGTYYDALNAYDQDLALTYFNEAYDQLLAMGALTDQDKIVITFTDYDIPVFYTTGRTLETIFEDAFGTERFDFVIEDVSYQVYSQRMASGDYDMIQLVLGYPNGLPDAFGMLKYYFNNQTFEPQDSEISVDLPDSKIALQTLLSVADDLDDQAVIQSLLDLYLQDTFTGTVEELSELYSIMQDHSYYNSLDELYVMVYALEQKLLNNLPIIPIFSSTSSIVFRENVFFKPETYHPQMEYGGYKYMYLNNDLIE